MNDQRRFRRIPFTSTVRLSRWLTSCDADLLDISLKGMLVQMDNPPGLTPGDSLKAVITLSPALKLTLRTRLVHRQDNRLGFVFTDADLDTLAHLRRLFELNTGEADRTLEELFHWGH